MKAVRHAGRYITLEGVFVGQCISRVELECTSLNNKYWRRAISVMWYSPLSPWSMPLPSVTCCLLVQRHWVHACKMNRHLQFHTSLLAPFYWGCAGCVGWMLYLYNDQQGPNHHTVNPVFLLPGQPSSTKTLIPPSLVQTFSCTSVAGRVNVYYPWDVDGHEPL